MTKRYTDSFNRDWSFFTSNSTKFQFSGTSAPSILQQRWVKKVAKAHNNRNKDGKVVPFIISSPKGVTAKEAYKVFDSGGKVIACKEPKLLQSVLQAKKAINFTIKLWADGFTDMLIPRWEYLEEFINPPEWVKIALYNQIDKKLYG